jgi:hypothetical protein
MTTRRGGDRGGLADGVGTTRRGGDAEAWLDGIGATRRIFWRAKLC